VWWLHDVNDVTAIKENPSYWVCLSTWQHAGTQSLSHRWAVVPWNSRLCAYNLWTPNLPDLNPVDYCVCGVHSVRARVPNTLSQAQQSWSTESRRRQTIPLLQLALQHWRHHFTACVKASGGQLEHSLGHFTVWISLSQSPKFGLETKDQPKSDVVFAERFAETKLRTKRLLSPKHINSPVDFACTW